MVTMALNISTFQVSSFKFRVSGSEFIKRNWPANDVEPETRNSKPKTLFPFEFRLSFLKKRAHAFVLIFSRKAKRKEINFAAQTLVEIRSRREFHRFLHQANGKCSFRVDDVAGENHLHRFAFADQAG